MIKIRSRSHNDPQKNKKHLLAASIWILSFHPACSAIVCSDLLSIPPLEWHYSLICTRMLPPAKQSFDNSFLLKKQHMQNKRKWSFLGATTATTSTSLQQGSRDLMSNPRAHSNNYTRGHFESPVPEVCINGASCLFGRDHFN